MFLFKWSLAPPPCLANILQHLSPFQLVFRAEGIYQSMKSFYGSSICHMLMINSRAVEQHSPNPLPDPWSQFIISTSKDTLVSIICQHSFNVQYINLLKLEGSPALYNHLMDVK